MSGSRLILALSLFCAALPVHAIPPPEVVVSVWQSVLQFLGIASVFIAGMWFSLRQVLEQYLGKWLRPVMYAFMALVICLLVWLFFMSDQARAESASTPLKGELLTIESIISRETDDWVRDWKLQTLREMKQEAILTRQRKGLSSVKYEDVVSFSPKDLHDLLQSRPDEIYLVDIREELERRKFRINHQAEYRYGDLVQGVLPANLPADKMIVVLCHSGLRGYLGAYFLRHAGYQRVAFLQGGLAAWNRIGLPVEGDEDFRAKRRPLLNQQQAQKLPVLKVQVDPDGIEDVKLQGLVRLPYETASTKELASVLEAAKARSVLLVCRSYGGCFHTTNLAWLIENQGGKVAGIYDQSGEHMQQFFE